MEVNSEMERAKAFINYTDTNIFLTGRAGTGKTTLLHDVAKNCPKSLIVVAPTGIAAINARGVTIHSFFQLPFTVFNPDAPLERQKISRARQLIMRSLEVLIVDEVSMVRADVLDAIDVVLRRYRRSSKPFGGVQLLLIGDMQQLPPVVRHDEWELMKNHYNSHYFFDSVALKKAGFLTLELEHIYRQRDREFIDILGKIRVGRADSKTLAALNSRCIKDGHKGDEQTITLCSHNHIADTINSSRMDQLDTPTYTYHAVKQGDYRAPEPVEGVLKLKVGCRVMFARNDSSYDKRYVNGTLATVTALDDECIEVIMDNQSEPYSLHKEVWETVHYDVDSESKQYVAIVDGTFCQYPLRTAWAVTIHKSQGLTFDKVILDASDSFDHGQVYVALSRCRTLQGITLLRPINARAIFTSSVVEKFNDGCTESPASEQALAVNAENYKRTLIKSIFNFADMDVPLRELLFFMQEHLVALYPDFVKDWSKAIKDFAAEVVEVSNRFSPQLDSLFTAPNEQLQERISKGAQYFADKLTPMLEMFNRSVADEVEIDSRENRKLFATKLENLYATLNLHIAVMEWAAVNEFSTLDLLVVRSKTSMEDMQVSTKRKKKAKKGADQNETDPSQDLVDILRIWRRDKAAQAHKPAYLILSQMGLLGIAKAHPKTTQELAEISGIGPAFMKNYADEVIDLLETAYSDF